MEELLCKTDRKLSTLPGRSNKEVRTTPHFTRPIFGLSASKFNFKNESIVSFSGLKFANQRMIARPVNRESDRRTEQSGLIGLVCYETRQILLSGCR
ncbi:hypothetical protein [Synechococcus sp. MIT S1220]|uniref:hypothetical protein n=1 Tax=Synechococcus sp. MIT S1220 TaxID=3082549 RepID=UPI0039AF0BC7